MSANFFQCGRCGRGFDLIRWHCECGDHPDLVASQCPRCGDSRPETVPVRFNDNEPETEERKSA